MALADALGPGPEEVETPVEGAAEAAPVISEVAKPEVSKAADPARPEGFVPHEALHEQREYNKRLQADLAEQKQRANKMEETFQKLILGMNEKATTPPPEIEKDPLGHFQAKNVALEAEIQNLKKAVEGTNELARRQSAAGQTFNALRVAENAFKAKQPDYDAAATYLTSARQEELAELGVPIERIGEVINLEVQQLTQSALQQGKNPAELAYSMAKRRGYKPASAAASSNMETLSKATDAAKTLGGGGTAGPITKLADLTQLDDAQLDALIKDDAKWNKLMRGQPIQ